jgi:hypothetical protein
VFQTKGLDEVLDILGIACNAVTPGYFLRVTMCAHVWSDDAAGLCEWGDVFLKEAMTTGPPGDQDQRAPLADLLVIKLDSIIGRDGWHLDILLSEVN